MTNAALSECSATVCHSARSWARSATHADRIMRPRTALSGTHTTEVSSRRTWPPTRCSAHVLAGCTAQRPSASQVHWEIRSTMTSLAFMTNTSDGHALLSPHPCTATHSTFLCLVLSFQSTAQVAVFRMNRTTPILMCLTAPHTSVRACHHQRRHTHTTHACTSSAVMGFHFD